MNVSVGVLSALTILTVFVGGCVNSTKTLSGQFSHLPAPQIAMLNSMPAMVKGGTILKIDFQSKSTSVLGVKGQIVEYSIDNGETFTRVADLSPSATSYDWYVPTVDATEAIIRVRVFDNLAYESKIDSPVFEIRSTPPVLTQNKQAANLLTNGNSVQYGGACEKDYIVVVEKLDAQGVYQKVGDVECEQDEWSFTVSSTTDGKFTYRISENDPVLNHTEVMAIWTRDTVAPALTQKNVAASVINNLNELNYGGDCETGLPVEIFIGTNTTAASTVACNNKLWAYKATSTADGIINYTFKQTDGATNFTKITAAWTRDTQAPNLTQNVAPAMSASNLANLALGGACENGLNVVLNVTTPTNNTANYNVQCMSSMWSYSYIAAADGNYTIKISQTDAATNKKEETVKWLRDTTAPVFTAGSLKLAMGAPSIMTNYIPVDLDAADVYSYVSHFCLKYNDDPMAKPSASDACWIRVNDPDQPNLPLRLTLALRQYLYRIGFTPATYSVQAWVRDELGNISNSESASIIYNPGQPPVVVNVIAGKSDSPVLPLSTSETSLEAGMPLYVRWKITAAINGLGNSPISVYYTTDDVNFTLIQNNLADAPNGSCSLLNGLASGCFVWNSTFPSSTYFRIRVAVTDKNGMITMVTTNPINGAGLSSLAGNTDSGVGGSATAAMFINARLGYLTPDPGAFVVTKEGRIFFRDTQKGLIYVNPKDGVVKVLMPAATGANSNTYEGPIPNALATVRLPAKLALDYKNGLLIHDYDRIRRIDLDTMRVSTLIGGGTSSGDNVAPTSVMFQPYGGYGRPAVFLPLVPLPNGDIYFQSGGVDTTGAKLRVFHAATNIVDSITVSGTGHGPNGSEKNIDTEDLTTCYTVVLTNNVNCRFTAFAMEYDPANSMLSTLHAAVAHVVVGNTYFPIANLYPSGANVGKSLAPHPPAEGSIDHSHYRITGRNGKMYSLNQFNGRISRFDKASNAWVKIVGATEPGTCPDGTIATQCAIQPTDAFVDAQGNLFFNDRGRIRTVDGTGKVVTVYGQSFFFGDGGLAISARFNIVPSLARINDGRIVLMDIGESRIREFMPGSTIKTIAGTGTVSSFPDFTNPASTQPFRMSGAAVQDYVFSVNPDNGDVYTSRGGESIVRIDRSKDLWFNISTKLYEGDKVSFHYFPNVLGFDGTKLLINTTAFDSSLNSTVNAYMKTVSLDGTVAPFAGVAGKFSGNFCADGTPLNSCEVPPGRANGTPNATYDSVASRWLAIKANSAAVRILPTDGVSPIQTLTTLERPATSFAYVRKSDGSEKVFYCGTNGRIYQRDVATATETALDWRINSLNCLGASLIYDSNRNALIFPYLQNSLYGVAEYRLP